MYPVLYYEILGTNKNVKVWFNSDVFVCQPDKGSCLDFFSVLQKLGSYRKTEPQLRKHLYQIRI